MLSPRLTIPRLVAAFYRAGRHKFFLRRQIIGNKSLSGVKLQPEIGESESQRRMTFRTR